MKSRHILFTSEVGPPIRNGVVASMESFAQGLRQLGHTVNLVVPRYRSSPRDTHHWLYPQIPVPLPYAKGYGLGLLGGIYQQIKSNPPDIIHTQHMFTTGELGIFAARRLKIPVIHTYHTYLYRYAHYALLPGANYALAWYSGNYANRVDRVIAPSTMIKDLLNSYHVRTPISILLTGIQPDDFPVKRHYLIHETIRKRLKIELGHKLLIYVGRIAAEKNIGLLLEMFAILHRKDQKTRLLLVGPGNLRQFTEHARRLAVDRSVIFAGEVSPKEVKEYLVASDIFVFASLTDTQGIVVLEAMAAGCVPVAVGVGGPIDIIRDRIDGRLSPPYASEFASRALSLLHNKTLYERLKANGFKKAKQFSYRHQAEELSAIYEMEIAKRRSI